MPLLLPPLFDDADAIIDAISMLFTLRC